MNGTASAPASAANLGPGFDALALALDLRCSVTVAEAGELTLRQGSSITPLAADDPIARAVGAAGGGAIEVTVDSPIPSARGLGSSAALATAVVVATRRLRGEELAHQLLFDLVAEVEGHPDNAAAAVYGGLVAVTGNGVMRLDIDSSLLVLVAVPSDELPTAIAREALSESIPRGVAVRTIRRALCLVEGLRTGDSERLAHAGGDELHEGPRGALSPITARLVAAARSAGALHAAWSGAGPSAIAFATADTQGQVSAAMEDVLAGRGEVLALNVDREGWS